jgi:hypothetical protein
VELYFASPLPLLPATAQSRCIFANADPCRFGAKENNSVEHNILIACIGNIFLGDDAFGVEVARRLANQALPEGVRVIDFGIRSYDLAYALMDDWEFVILVDAAPRGGLPGTVPVRRHKRQPLMHTP